MRQFYIVSPWISVTTCNRICFTAEGWFLISKITLEFSFKTSSFSSSLNALNYTLFSSPSFPSIYVCSRLVTPRARFIIGFLITKKKNRRSSQNRIFFFHFIFLPFKGKLQVLITIQNWLRIPGNKEISNTNRSQFFYTSVAVCRILSVKFETNCGNNMKTEFNSFHKWFCK